MRNRLLGLLQTFGYSLGRGGGGGERNNLTVIKPGWSNMDVFKFLPTKS